MHTVSRLLAVWLMASAVPAAAQTPGSSLTGRVVGPDGAGVAEAPVRAVSASPPTDARAFSDADGYYELGELPAGEFTLSVSMPCCAFAPYTEPAIVLSAGEARRFDIELREGGSLNVLGDDPGTINAELRRRSTVPDLPAPRRADGAPDLSGIWLIRGDPFPATPRALPWAEEVAAERIASDFRDHPHTRCLPSKPFMPGGSSPFISKIVQTADLMVILFEDVPGYRQIFLDGRSHPEIPNPSWMGHSIGRWDGDTLVVDTIGFNGRVWMDAYPTSGMLHVVERFTRVDYGRMEVHVTVNDPDVFVESWDEVLRYDLARDIELLEFVCENNKWAR